MTKKDRKYPMSLEDFEAIVEPIIKESYIWKGRPAKISNYKVFSAVLYVMRTGIASLEI